QVCILLHTLEIHNFYIDDKCGLLTDQILSNYHFIKKLDASNNPTITNVNHMTKLEILHAYGNCGIDDNGISELNLKKLYASYNFTITNVNHMSKLEILHACSNCGIDDNGISELNLKELYASYNFTITNVNHM